MKLTMARGELLESLSITARGLSSRSTLPILSGILIEATEEGTVSFTSTDLEVSIRNISSCLVEKAGAVVIPGRLVTDIIKSLPEAAVTIAIEGEIASVSCGNSSFTVKTLRADDFPKFPEVDPQQETVVKTEEMTQTVGHVIRAVSRDETRPILTGVLLSLDGPVLRMVATDSYRLAVKETVSESDRTESMEVIVPGRALEEVVRLASGQKDVSLGVTENQIIFKIGETTFVTRRIEGTFPNYRQLIPKEFETKVSVNREALVQAVKRVSLLAQHNTPLRLTVSSEDKTISLSATTQDVGDASEDLMAEISGPDVEIAFNHSFLADGVGTISGDTATFEIVSPLKPGVLKAQEDEGFLYLLMPVRLS